ncbi:MAG: agmatinase [Selenomonadaceae bacterium]|nr:agmatinase [Selenomonadaceae bacterium]
MKKNVETFLGCDAEYAESQIVIFGAPFDSTTSYRAGARFGSRTMRAESYGLETYSPYQDLDVTDFKIFDGGDLELCFGDTNLALADIENLARKILADGKIPLMLGGEHLVTLGAFRAAAEKFPEIAVIHFDAHTDLRDDYLGAKLSHAAVIRRLHDIVGDGKIFQFGIRSGDRPEFEFAKNHTCLNKFNFDGLAEVLAEVNGLPIYLTIDLDVLDPSVFPGTGTPEAGGVSFLELLNAALKVIRGSNVVALDMVELSPPYDPSGISTATALKLLREILLALSVRR